MSVPGTLRRHRVAIASNLALLVAAAGIVVVATQADGYRKHDAQLHDGGIWVTNGRDGYHGRINKPIAQLDGVAFAEQDTQLDVVQDGAAVFGINLSAGVLSVIDPGKVTLPEGETAQLPSAPLVQLAGGTLAVLDPAEGSLWAERVDTRAGVDPVSALDTESDPTATTSPGAGLAVALDGSVLVASGEDDQLRRFPATEAGLGAPTTEPLGADLGESATVTAVGDRAVVLDTESGVLQVVGGPDADVPPGSQLQVPGPAASSVLVATPSALVAIDLASGEATDVVRDGIGGRPTTPVRLGACSYGAWSGGFGAVATACDGAEPRVSDLGTDTADLVFRVNRGEIVLNDRSTGAVWDLDSDRPTRLDNWDDFRLKPDKTDKNEQNENQDQGDRRPPQAEDDDLGARPGRTTVLHPLDNDTAPAGRLLAIAGVQGLTGSDAEVTISPDGQTVQIELPEGAGPTRFDYTIDDGRSGVSDTATVRVTPRSADADAAPQLREGFEPRTWTVPAGGTLDIPVLPDWRDKADGDPLALDTATAAGGARSGAVARTTSSGRVRFTAPARSGVVSVQYAVTDGIGEPVTDKLTIQVQDVKDRKAYPGVAEPDVVAGEAGRTVTIRPLANDLPGSDPVTPTAVSQLAGKVAQVGGAKVTTDLVDGTVTFVADKPRTYFLDYDLRYGNAAFDRGRIRVDVKAPDKPPEAPVAMPDSVTLYGQAATLVDVVANDIDPTGGILVVQGAVPDRDDSLDVAVVQGRWLRVSARTGELRPNPQLVRYTISNGSRSGVEGQVVVTWRPAPADNTPVTEDDRAVVRAGGAVSVPVLDNDFSPAGDELDLVSDLPDQDAGVLAVRSGDDEEVPTGQAFVTDRFVRYVAPRTLDDAETFTIRYVATNAAGQRAPGTLEVQVVPAARRNEPPEPPVLEARAVAGDTVRLRLPGVGVDPDGDPVTLTGIASAPTLGRIVRFGATSLVYQAYPGSVGTDEFTYSVVDALGAEATGEVRVAVTAPGTPQPPLAVSDTITTEAGRVARMDVLANDYVAAGDRVTLSLPVKQPGVRLESPQGPLVVTAPRTGDRNVEVVYRVTNGLDSSQSTATLRLADSFNNPPVVFDAYGTPAADGSVGDGAVDAGDVDGEGDASSVSVDVLETAYDPDGDDADLRVAEVIAPPGVTASVAGGEVVVERGREPLVVPFRVTDADGGSATASIYVPPLAGGAPYVVPGATIEVAPGDTADLDLADYVVDPSGGPVAFTLRDRISASPSASLSPRITGEDTFEVAAARRYAGPGAVVFEVTTGDSVDDPDGVEAVLSVPVQVGDAEPILRCPSEPVRVAQARSVTLDVASLCHVWTPDPADADDLSFDADWRTSVDGLGIIDPQGPTIEVNADGATPPGSRATLEVTSGGSAPGLIEVVVVKSPPPTLAPIRLDDMSAGEQRTIDLAPYLRAGVTDAQPTVVSVRQLTGLDVRASADGSSVRLTTGDKVDGRAEFAVVMSDVTGSTGPERQAEGRLVLEVLDRPDTPGAPVPGNAVRDREVVLSWREPAQNGSPIDRYEVRGGGVTQSCGGTTCEVGGLQNGRDYRFQVRAHNAVGWSEWSSRSAVATPDARPGRVGPITLVKEGDGFVRIRWTPPANETSRIKQYVVSWQNGGSTTTRSPELTANGLDNNRPYSFTVYAINQTFRGEARVSGRFQSFGTPRRPAAPVLTEARTSSDDTAVQVTWPAVDPPNGPGPVRYTVLRDGRPVVKCVDITKTSCTNAGIQYDGTTYSYSVRATNKNGTGRTSTGPATTFRAVGEPEPWGPWSIAPTGADNTGTTTYTVPDTNGAQSRVRIYRDNGLLAEFDATGARTEPIATPDNDGPHAFQLEACNEKGACVRSDVQNLQTYGPLNRRQITNMTWDNNGKNVKWSITVDANGDPATLTVDSDKRPKEVFQLRGPGTFTFVTTNHEIGFAQTETLTATLSDAAPARGPAQRQATSARTQDPPDPTVTISKGEACRDGTSNPCGGSASAGTLCNVPQCARIRFESANWEFNPMFCDMVDTRTGKYINDRQIATNRPVSPGPYYGFPGETVHAECGDSSGTLIARSNDLRWPN